MYGGENHGGISATVWDPATDSLLSVPTPYNVFCSGHSALADGRILVVGGHDNAAGILGSNEATIFDPVTETWTLVPRMAQRRWSEEQLDAAAERLDRAAARCAERGLRAALHPHAASYLESPEEVDATHGLRTSI